jgi:drug/metabolite transporter (DMT)-like permease
LSINSTAFTPPETNNLKGAFFVFLCCGLLAMGTLIARALGPEMSGAAALHPVQVAWARFTVAAAIITPIALFAGVSPRGAPWALHAGRITTGVAGIVTLFAAVGLMPRADATAISFLAPLFIMLFAILFLGEKVGAWRWSAAGVAFIGAMVITRPGTEAFQPVAFIALASAAFIGAEITFIRRISQQDRPLRVLAINNIGAALLLSCVVPFFWKTPSLDQVGLMILLGSVMIGSQGFFLRGIAMAEANITAPIFYTTLIFAAFYAWVLFGEVPAWTTWAGASLIIGGALVLTWRENLARKRAARSVGN